MKFKYKVLLILAPFVFILDQLAKYLIVKRVALGEAIAVVPGFFDIVHYTNAGAAFGMFSGLGESIRTPFFYTISVIALAAILFYIIKMPDEEHLMAVVFSLVIGGIFGNGLDRLKFGYVTDFLSLHIGDKILWGVRLEWPAFNVADSAITMAMILLAVSMLKK